jgi:4'-phosphopantetheinyl transferase
VRPLAGADRIREHAPMQLSPAPVRAPPWDDHNVHLWWHPTDPAERAPRARRGRLDRLLREVLSRYVEAAPAALRFGREARGRPFLLDGGPDFNLSDTTGATVVAVARQPRIGVDLERIDRLLPHRRLAARYYAHDEQGALQALDEDGARRAFLQLWTAKEASCNSTGTGIYGQLDRWRFDPAHLAPRLLAAPEAALPAARWRHLRLEPAPDYTAVLACDGFAPRVRGFLLPA